MAIRQLKRRISLCGKAICTAARLFILRGLDGEDTDFIEGHLRLPRERFPADVSGWEMTICISWIAPARLEQG